ncbi:unnamed protein product [Prunus armeniaca]
MGGQPKEGIAIVPQFYNPLTTSLQPRDKTWQRMKTTAELRREHNIPIPVNKDSLYKFFFVLSNGT